MTKDWLKLLYLLTKCRYFKISITFAEKLSSRLIQNLEQCRILIINITPLNTCWSFNNTYDKISTESWSCANRHVFVWMFEPNSILTINHKNIFRTEILWIGQTQLRLQCVIKNKLFVILKHFECPNIIYNQVSTLSNDQVFLKKWYIFTLRYKRTYTKPILHLNCYWHLKNIFFHFYHFISLIKKN